MRAKIWGVVLSLALLVPLAIPQDVTGNLEGFILDSQDIPIGGASIIISGPNLQGTRGATTDERGHFLVLLLPAGSYNVKIAHPAYQEARLQDVSIRIGRTVSIGEIQLQSKSAEAHEVTVLAEKPILDPSSSASGASLEARTYETLPIERNYRNISLLLPSATQSFLGDREVNLSGGTGLENRYFIDGIDVTSPAKGDSGINLPFNFIKEFELRTGGYEPEYRGSLGGIVNVITYSGGNEFSGEVFGYYANNRFSGSPRLGELEPPKGDFSRYDFGLSLGGPIVRDRLWFFLAYDPSFEREDVTIPGLGYFPDRSTMHSFAGKLTWWASPKTTLVATALGDPSRRNAVGSFLTVQSLPTSVLNPDPYLANTEKGGLSFSLKGTHILNDDIFIEASLSRFSAKDNLLPATERGWDEPAFVDAENGIWAGGVGNYAKYQSNEWTLGLKGTLRLANHLVKVGFEYRDNRLDFSWMGRTLTRYNESYYGEVVLLMPEGTFRNRIPTLFVQDSWELSRRFSVNFGLRWDGQFLVGSNGKVAQKILGQYQPRIGVIFEPGKVGTQKIFGSFGRFYQELAPYAISNYWNGPAGFILTDYDHDPRIDSSGGTSLVIAPGFQDENPDLEGQHYDEFTLGYERLLGRYFKIGMRGIYRTLRQIIEDSWDQEAEEFFWGNPGKGRLSEFPRPRREYSALELIVERPVGQKVSFQASYVLSRSYGNYVGLFTPSWGIAPNTTNQYDYPELLVNATGLLPNDRTHVFKFFGSYRLPFGLTIGTSVIWQSGTPLSELGGSLFGSLWNSFLGQRGTAGRTPAIFDLNFRATYDLVRIIRTSFRPMIFLDIFHLTSSRTPVAFEQVHYFGVDPVSGEQIYANPLYGRPTLFFPPMSARLGFEIRF